MNRKDCPKKNDAIAEIVSIGKQIKKLIPFSTISKWDKINWGIALFLALGGLAAVPFSDGVSLIATILGIVWLLIDMAKKISETAKDEKTKQHADKLEERLIFLQWCLKIKRI